jgi:hypothetical protein
MTTLRYRSNVGVEDLAVGECTIHRAGDATGKRWWLLWFYVNCETDGQPKDFAVPVNPNGGWIEDGPGGKTWALTRDTLDASTWHVSPSINVINTGDVHAGEHTAPSLWHQTPDIIGVIVGDAWVSQAP